MATSRRLVAILAADVAGYSRLMEADEEGTLAALKAIRREFGDPKVKEHHGRIVKTTGDGLLIEFASVVDAVRCAVEVQQGMAERNADVPKEKQIEFRIGINLGDVIRDGRDIFGDGVNIAARLEALAEPGGICVSRVVHDQVRDKLDVAFDDMGEQQVKNIARPVHVYRVRTALTHPAARAPGSPLSRSAGEGAERQRREAGEGNPPLPDKPSLAVLPFQNMTGDAEQDYFVDGVVEEITTAISRLSWLFVIARNSAFTYKGRAVDVKQVARELGVRYVLEGSVRKASNRVRITGQLIDTDSGAHIWADRFDGTLDDIFELQDQVASSVAGAIEPKLRQSEIERARRKPTNNLNAHDFYLRALAEFRKWTIEGWHGSIELLRRALAIDPSYAPAAGLFGWCRILQLTNLLISSEEIAEGARLARQAIEADKEDPDALWMGGWGIFMLAGEHASGLNAIERSLALNSNCALAWAFCGWARGLANRPAPAIEALGQAMRLSPLDPQRSIFFGGLSLAHLVAGHHEEAVEWADRALRENPRMTAVVNFKVAACGYLGRFEEAREAIKRLNELLPGRVVANVRRSYETFVSPEVRAIFVEGHRKVGLTEE